MGRFVGIDYGTRRIGIAISDRGARIATPATTLTGSGAPASDADIVLQWATDQRAAGFVVGLPLNMSDGSDSDQTRLTRRFADALRSRTPLPIELWDERLSSFAADELLSALPPKRRQQMRDAVAAQVILQSFLDYQRGQSEPPPTTA